MDNQTKWSIVTILGAFLILLGFVVGMDSIYSNSSNEIPMMLTMMFCGLAVCSIGAMKAV